MIVGTPNQLRARAIAVSRSVREVFGRAVGKPLVIGIVGIPVLATALAVLAIMGRKVMRREAYRAVFRSDDALTIAGQHVLADLRDFTFAATSAFDPDPIMMARRQGRRDVWLRLSNYLNLDEAETRKLMEIDDGI